MGKYQFVSPGAAAGDALAQALLQHQASKRQAMLDDMEKKLKQATLEKAAQEQAYNEWNAAKQRRDSTDINTPLTPEMIQKNEAAGAPYNVTDQPAVPASPAVTTPPSTSIGSGVPGTTIGEGDAPAPITTTPERTTPAVMAQAAQKVNAGTDEQQATADQKHYQKIILNTDYSDYSQDPSVKGMPPADRAQFREIQRSLHAHQAGIATAPMNPERADLAAQAAADRAAAASNASADRASAAATARDNQNSQNEANRANARLIAGMVHPAGGDQPKLEQEYRTILMRPLAMRSGGLGLEDQKVNQAIHLRSLFDQNRDPKTGEYHIPNVLMTEIAMGLARLISPSGVVGEGTVRDISQHTAKGDAAKAYTYLTGTPVTGSTQDVMKMFKDSIDRQGTVAEQNREGDMQYIRALAPTDLDEARKSKLEQGMLNFYTKPAAANGSETPEARAARLRKAAGL